MGQVLKPLMTVLLTLIVCLCSQAFQNLRQSLGGPNPIQHDLEDPMRSEAYGIYLESPWGLNPIHHKMEDQIERILLNPIEKLQMVQIQYTTKWRVKDEWTLMEFIEQLQNDQIQYIKKLRVIWETMIMTYIENH